MGLAFPFGFWVDDAPTSNKFALTDCSNPEIVLYTNTDLGEYTDGSIINYEGNCFNVESLEEFPPGAEVIEIGEIERVYPPEEEPPGCDCCQNGDTYQITDCEGTVVGVVNLTDLEVTTGNVVKIEENENCFIVGEKVCTPADLVFFEQVPCLEDPTECCNECGEEPPAENFSYTVCGSPEIAFVSEIQLHEEGAQSIWFNCQWYGIGETTPLGPGPITPLVEEVVSSLLPCEAAQETQQVLKWVKCGTEEEFIYTECCELPEEANYTPGVTTTNNFILPEPSSACYTFVGPAQLPEGIETAGCPEFVLPLNCGDEACIEEPPIPPEETPKLTVDGGEPVGSNQDYTCTAPDGEECPPFLPYGSQEEPFGWIILQYSEEGPEGQDVQTVFTTEGFFEGDFPNGLTIVNQVGAQWLPTFGFNAIGNFIPGENYQINITQDSSINTAAVEGLEGMFTIVG